MPDIWYWNQGGTRGAGEMVLPLSSCLLISCAHLLSAELNLMPVARSLVGVAFQNTAGQREVVNQSGVGGVGVETIENNSASYLWKGKKALDILL